MGWIEEGYPGRCGALYIEPALNEEAAESQFTITKLGWPVCPRSQN